MPTKLYVQWPKRPELANNTRLLYFRYPLSQTYHDNLEKFSISEAFCVYAVVRVNDKNRELEETIPLGKIITSEDLKSDYDISEIGSNPKVHPDQMFFEINGGSIREKMKQIRDSIKDKKVIGFSRIEIHSSLVPCLRKFGCKDFLQNNIMGYLDSDKAGDIDRRDIWCITYRPEKNYNDFDSTTNVHTKERDTARAISANARRLDNIGTAVNHDPENGTIRCMKSVDSYEGKTPVCKSSRFILDDLFDNYTMHDSDYKQLLEYQEELLKERLHNRNGPELPVFVQNWQLARIQRESAHPLAIMAAKKRLKNTKNG